MNLNRFVAKYRTQVLLGLGALAAFFAFRARAQQGPAVVATIGASSDPTGAYIAGVQTGAELYGAGVAQGIGPTETALGLAGASVSGAVSLASIAAALAQAMVGDFTALGGFFGNLLGGWASPPPATAPPAGGQNQPGQTPPINGIPSRQMLPPQWADGIVRRVFRPLMVREPNRSELDRYGQLVTAWQSRGLSERQIEQELRARILASAPSTRPPLGQPSLHVPRR